MLKPLNDRVIVKAITAEETTRGGIVLPDTAKEKPQEGEVVAVGPGKLMDSGKILLVNLAKGKIGEGPSALFGSLLLSVLALAALALEDPPYLFQEAP